MKVTPPKPSRLSLWMSEHGRPSQLKVEYRQTGPDTADTWIVLSTFDGMTGKKAATIEIKPGDLMGNRYGHEPGDDTFLVIDHAHCVDWTEMGRKRLDDWKSFEKKEATDLAEFKRLKAKFGSI